MAFERDHESGNLPIFHSNSSERCVCENSGSVGRIKRVRDGILHLSLLFFGSGITYHRVSDFSYAILFLILMDLILFSMILLEQTLSIIGQLLYLIPRNEPRIFLTMKRFIKPKQNFWVMNTNFEYGHIRHIFLLYLFPLSWDGLRIGLSFLWNIICSLYGIVVWFICRSP